MDATSHDYPIEPVPFNQVVLEDSFWLPRLKTQKERTLPFAFEKTERSVESLRRCANFLKGRGGELPLPHRFAASDLYKVMEGAAYLLMLEPDPTLEAQMDEIIAIIAEAQQDDGYLYVSHICGVARPSEMGETPYSWVVHSHELYNMGHMYEGAVAYFRATGKRNWLDVAEKSARHINRVIFEGDPNYNEGKPVNQAPGHQEIEIGLCKLYSVTGEKLYLNMAKRLLDVRGVTYTMELDGKGVMSPEYAQQHRPVAEQEKAVGHSVRAAYMYAGMADVGAMTHDHVYDAALDRIWSNIVDTRMHITGGLGAIHGIEGFGPEYDLPNKDAYNETCAAIANVFFNHRLFLHHRDAKFFDVAEVALLNNSLAGVNLEGDRFFYVNPLEADGIRLFNHGNAGRAPWFDCACCPSNIARIVPQVSGYMYAANGAEIYCLLYGSSRTEIALEAGSVGVVQKSDYPFDGYVRLSFALDDPQQFAAKLRIPTWAQDQFVPGRLYSYIGERSPEWTVSVNGEQVTPRFEKGFAIVTREWQDGDTLELDLPMPVRYSVCDEKVEANIDRIAVTRGPLVYCAEEADNDGLVQHFMLPDFPGSNAGSVESIADGPLAGMPLLTIPALELGSETCPAPKEEPALSRAGLSEAQPRASASEKPGLLGNEQPAVVRLVPYFAWNNRGNGSMNVWFPRNAELAQAAMVDARFDSSNYGDISVSSCGNGDSVDALTDGHRPQSAADKTIQRWSSADGDCIPTIELTFPQSQKVESLGVYWAEDDARGIAVPAEWRMEYSDQGEWHDFNLYVTDFFGVDKDMYVVVHPAAELECEGLRLVITPAPGKRVGLLDLDLVAR